MGLLEGKSWIAQELYNEYLQLKSDIMLLAHNREWYVSIESHDRVQHIDESLAPKVDKLRSVLDELRVYHNVDMSDLILLSLGVDV